VSFPFTFCFSHFPPAPGFPPQPILRLHSLTTRGSS
jgi:hypothetical protein